MANRAGLESMNASHLDRVANEEIDGKDEAVDSNDVPNVEKRPV